MIRTNPRRRLGLAIVLVAVALVSPCSAWAQAPHPGDVQRLKVITISMRVGSTEKESKQVTYTPPPGWYVRSHAVECTAKYGNSSFTVTTVPQNWSWLSEERVRDSYKLLMDLAGKAQDMGLQARYALERDAALQASREVRSTQHALVVEATARGEGFLRGGGGIELTVTADLVYVGTALELGRAAAQPRLPVASLRLE